MKDHKSYLRDTFLASSYLHVPKYMVKLLGLKSSIYFTELVNKEKVLEYVDKLQADDHFYFTMQQMNNETGLSRREQENAVELLCQLGMIHYYDAGTPRKRYYKINHERASKICDCMHSAVSYDFGDVAIIIKSYLHKNSVTIAKMTDTELLTLWTYCTEQFPDLKAHFDNKFPLCYILRNCVLYLAQYYARCSTHIIHNNNKINNKVIKIKSTPLKPKQKTHADTTGVLFETVPVVIPSEYSFTQIATLWNGYNLRPFRSSANLASLVNAVIVNNHPDPSYWEDLIGRVAANEFYTKQEWFSINWLFKSEENRLGVLRSCDAFIPATVVPVVPEVVVPDKVIKIGGIKRVN